MPVVKPVNKQASNTTIICVPIQLDNLQNTGKRKTVTQSLGKEFCTDAGLCVARLLRLAYTSLAAMFRLGIGASPDLSPATTRFRACAEDRKAAMYWN